MVGFLLGGMDVIIFYLICVFVFCLFVFVSVYFLVDAMLSCFFFSLPCMQFMAVVVNITF